jgi:hypothetical protein
MAFSPVRNFVYMVCDWTTTKRGESSTAMQPGIICLNMPAFCSKPSRPVVGPMTGHRLIQGFHFSLSRVEIPAIVDSAILLAS